MRYPETSYYFKFENREIDSLCNLYGDPEIQNKIREFCSQQNERSRKKILIEIYEVI